MLAWMRWVVIILFGLQATGTSAMAVERDLLRYQSRYSLCHGKSDYQIAVCLINGNLNLSRLRGDHTAYRYISPSRIRKEITKEDPFSYVMRHMPQTRRYRALKAYLDYLYDIEPYYFPPRFKGDAAEDMVRMKRIFNLLMQTRLEETPERTPDFDAALLAYQRRHGLTPDGKIGPRTRREMKRPLRSIIRKIKKNLTWERVSQPKPPTSIVVNIPEYRMHYYRNGREILHMKTVVGKPKMRTPLFYRDMQYIILNPRWYVPPSIYHKEYRDKSPEYLRRRGFAYDSNGRLYQKPGRRNALGKVKFLFPNRFNVYMHDTPSKSLFKRTIRAFSHGCIRLEKPLALLHALGYAYQPGVTRRITLKEQIPVFIEYHTVWVDQKGIVQFRPDIYGYERKLFY